MDCIVEIDAREDGEYVGLQKGNQQFQRGQCDDQRERERGTYNADKASAAEKNDEARKHFQRDMPREHVGEQTHAV